MGRIAPDQAAETRQVAEQIQTIESLIARNRAWAARKTRVDPGFFARLANQQNPAYFWVGCSDSRVPATEIVDLDPGEMFVHRNVANLVPADDPNFTAALAFAVEVLRVRHVIVVGHYGCGGIQAASKPLANDALGKWLSPLRSLYLHHERELTTIDAPQRRDDRLCELNVVAQIQALSRNPVITRAWAHRSLTIHGMIYSLRDGLIGAVCDAVSSPAGEAHAQVAQSDDELDANIM